VTQSSGRIGRPVARHVVHKGHGQTRSQRVVAVTRSRVPGEVAADSSSPHQRQTRPDHFAVTAQIDSKGRIRLPKKIQNAIAVAPGDSVFFNVEWVTKDTPTLRVAKAINPLVPMLDALAEDAERAHRAGETVRFHDLIAQYREDLKSGVDADDVD